MFTNILMGKALCVSIYHIVTENPNVRIKELQKYNSCSPEYVMENQFFYDEYEIIGYALFSNKPDEIPLAGNPLLPKDFKNNGISYGNSINKIRIGGCIEVGSNQRKVYRIMNILIRTEQEMDYRKVEEITKAAFSYPERIERGGIGCPYEHWMVHELRKRDGILALSLVAEVDQNIVGHIMCSKSEVRTVDGVIPVLNFGPLSVLPAMQRKGVGKALIKHMIWKATQLGYGAILFFGRPEYYPQFGFKEASAWQITDANGYNYPAFMGMELISGYLSYAKGGKYYESDIYDDAHNRNKVKEYDNLYFASSSLN